MLASAQTIWPSGKAIELLAPKGIIHQTDWPFLGISIDTSLVTGGYWWQESAVGEAVQPALLRLDDANLRQALAALAPVHIRLGGTEADRLYLGNNAKPEGFNSQLTEQDWQQLVLLSQSAQGDLLFNLGLGPMHRQSPWLAKDLIALLMQWSPNFTQNQLHFELGNEANGHFFFFGPQHQLNASQYLAHWQQTTDSLSQHQIEGKLLAKGSAFWPWIGEVNWQWAGSTPGFQQQSTTKDISWHYYPSQSFRCGLRSQASSAQYLLSNINWQQWHRQQSSLPDTSRQWLTEIGPAQCGGDPGLDGSYEQGLWWLTQLALASQSQHRLYRQTLKGASYGLLDQDWQPKADWHATLLWQQVASPWVLNGQQEQQLWLFSYCHSEPRAHSLSLAINLGPKEQRLVLPTGSQWQAVDRDFQTIGRWQATTELKLTSKSLILIKQDLNYQCAID